MPGEELLIQGAQAIQQKIAGSVQMVVGAINRKKAIKEAKELQKTRPQREISPYAQDDLSLAESELAGGGLSSRAETAYNNLNNQQFASSLSAILRGGGSVNNVAEVYGENQEGRTRLALLNDQMRLQKINSLVRARTNMSDEQEKVFEFNKVRPWMDRAQANAEARKGAEEMIWSGFGTSMAGGMNAAGTAGQQQQYSNYFSPQQQQQPANQGYQPQPWQRGQYDQGGIYGDPYPELMQFRTG